MVCSKCNSNVKVTSTYTSDEGVVIRRYKCTNCGSIYYMNAAKQFVYDDPEARKLYGKLLHEKAIANLTKGAD